MNGRASRLFAIKSPFPKPRSTLRVLEEPGSPEELWKRLFEGTYDKPFIVDSGIWRFLQFDLDSVQSAMHRLDPYRLTLAYTRKMMAFLLFNDAPQRILLLGLGGGSLAKFCHRRLPAAIITAVEIDPHVIALRGEFHIPADDDRFRVIRADAASYLAGLQQRKDVILSDACDRAGTAQQLDALEFYRNVRRCLSPGGVFVTNLCGELATRAAHLAKIRDVFGDSVMTLQVKQHRNVVAFACQEPGPGTSWARIESAAGPLKRRFGLDFPRYARRIALDREQRKWRHAFIGECAQRIRPRF